MSTSYAVNILPLFLHPPFNSRPRNSERVITCRAKTHAQMRCLCTAPYVQWSSAAIYIHLSFEVCSQLRAACVLERPVSWSGLCLGAACVTGCCSGNAESAKHAHPAFRGASRCQQAVANISWFLRMAPEPILSATMPQEESPRVSTILLRMPGSDDPRRHGPNNPEDTPASSLTGPLGNLKVGALSYMVGVWIPREKNLRAKKIDRLADTGHG